ncbi:hypothetical protein POL68_30545 [Stigmatella sp. ncwal1]|uniref:Lipoprotein n=1 Tax=Stigmatella ashevillensis TaxID=2995309 RepID=A0ABT5DGP5_9BACT|nr:hypothetical protein [Stigmatella ashevillena]MDC0712840.1 hypothetical protein [Stigmatella ashevillena]
MMTLSFRGGSGIKALVLQALLLTSTGCFHVHRKPRIASEQVAATIQFPEWSQDKTTTVTGPQLRALQIAMDDFRPLGSEPSKKDDAWTQCLLNLETYDAWVRSGEGVTFIHFTPQEDARCGLQPKLMDAGASYAVSDEGVILKRE